MTVREIRLFGDPVLHTVADDVLAEEFGTDGLRQQVADMLETMDAAGGVGLAANQIGKLNRVIVFDTRGGEGKGLRGVLINPRWEALGDDIQRGSEGCLSIPDISAEVDRLATIRVHGYDVEGRPVAMTVTGLLSRCVQHEVDHLDGILFPRRLTSSDRKRVMARIRQSAWFNE